MRPLVAQCKAELLRTARNRRFIIFSIVMPAAFYFMFVSLIGGDKQIEGASWNAYYLMSMSVFGLVGASLNTLGIRLAQERAQGWVRLQQTTPMPPWVYLISKITAQFVMNFCIVLVLFLVGGTVEHVQLSLAQWGEAFLWICLGSLSFMSMGIFIGLVTGSEAAQVVATGTQLLLAMLGGLWMPTTQLPHWMQEISKWLPTYRFGHISWNIVGGLAIHWADAGVLMAYGIIFMLLSILKTKRQEAMDR